MAVRFNLHDLMHPFDRSARSKLEAVPLLPTVLNAFGKVYSDKVQRQFLLANAVRLGPRQLPEYHRMLPPICDALGIEVPEMYLMAGEANAMAIGTEKPMIVVFSGLLEACEDDEVRAVVAHECGHIAFKHVLYRQVADRVSRGGLGLVGAIPGLRQLSGVALTAVEETLLSWHRKSELSADRVAALCTGGPEPMKRAIFHMIGIPKWMPVDVNFDEFEAQTQEFDAVAASSMWKKLIDNEVKDAAPSHPAPIARVKYLQDWTRSDAFRILTGAIEQRRDQAGTRCSHCQGQLLPAWRFCQTCGTSAVPAIDTNGFPAALEGPQV